MAGYLDVDVSDGTLLVEIATVRTHQYRPVRCQRGR